MKRIGIFGGTFNPIHIAHLIIAEEIRQQLQLDKIIFVVSGNPPHKNTYDIIDAKIRLRLINIAIKGNKYFESSDIEIKSTNNSKSYTINTLKKLKNLFRNANFFLLIGYDSFIELNKWKEPNKLFKFAKVIVFNRGGYSVNKSENDYAKKVQFVSVPNIEISSTDIRKRIKGKRTIKYLMPREVREFIVKKKLYL